MSAGFFGKLPGHGDFVDRGLPPAFKEVWDEWLQHGIANSRAVLGDAWLDAYLTSPIWRFALAPGLCGETGWIGVMVPSVDRVGRYFPLTVAASVGRETIPLQMLVAAVEWHDAVQEIALGALQDDTVTADILEEGIRLRSDPVLHQPSIACQKPALDPRQSLNAQALWLPFSYGSTPGHGLLAFSHRMLEALFGSIHSVWWTHGSDRVQPGMFACPQLPDSDTFSGLLSDSHQAQGWIQLGGYLLDGGSLEATPDSDHVEAAPETTTTASDGVGSASGPSPSQFDDLIEDAVPGSFDVPVVPNDIEDGDKLINDPPPSSSGGGGAEPVAVSADEILAGFGEPGAEDSEAAGVTEGITEKDARRRAEGDDT